MHPDPTEPSSSPSQHSIFGGSSNSIQHGLPRDLSLASTSSPLSESAYGGPLGSTSPSEWSLSPSSPADHEAGLSTPSSIELDAREFRLGTADDALTALDSTRFRTGTPDQTSQEEDYSILNELPDEMLFQVMSHLPAADLLTVKLVSRRLHTLVTSPLAWMNAFSKFFPGPDALILTNDSTAPGRAQDVVKSEQRRFNRLAPSASWSSEYLTRTRLLRCLERGRPALPFASPAPGKPGKGSATFSFSTRLRLGCSNLHADFGTVFDKRKPQFVHGFAANASVSSSDRKGKFDSWGFTNHVGFAHFSETHPGHALYGLGQGTVVGVPNMMDVSQRYGMIYGEGKPGGTVFHLGAEDKHGITLAPFLNVAFPDQAIPKVSQDMQATCAVWIAKSQAIPQMTRGMIGMLAGSSSGVISAYSLGPISRMNQRFARGQLTARWLLSPGVPIIAITADDSYSQDRADLNRVWAVALNALGEVFYLKGLPQIANPGLPSGVQQEVGEEIQAWASGNTAQWMLTQFSLRSSRYADESEESSGLGYLPSHLLGVEADNGRETATMSAWMSKTPGEFRAQFHGWDMRRLLQVDFASDDENAAGEAIFVIACGHEETTSANIVRYVRATITSQEDNVKAHSVSNKDPKSSSLAASAADPLQQKWSFTTIGKDATENLEDSVTTLKPALDTSSTKYIDSWQQSNFAFGGLKNITISATALDESHTARILVSEDSCFRRLRAKLAEGDHLVAEDFSSQVPGQRARFLAVGTGAGTILIWNARAPASQFLTLTNDVQPFRVIHTESPGISSLAMSALYLVHGGSEGLVQAWDPLASNLDPLRTLSSRHAMNSRRRAVIASQQNGGQQGGNWQLPLSTLAASAIQLDPDPHVLRGVVAIGAFLKYWSYSSVALAEDLSRSQKRRMKRTQTNGQQINGSMEYLGAYYRKGRRAHPHNYIDQEVLQHKLERRERAREEQHERRMAGRFGLDLLGEDASEEEMLAYAKLLSEEENERQVRRSKAAEARAAGNPTSEDLEAHRFALSDADAQKWKFASWDERYKMLPEGMAPPATSEMVHIDDEADTEVDEELKQVLELSRLDASSAASTSPARAASSSSASHIDNLAYDPDLAEAIALSMSESEARASSPPDTGSSWTRAAASRASASASAEEDDLARAIQISLQMDASPAASAGDGAATPTNSTRPSAVLDDDSFPALSPSPSPGGSPALKPAGAWRSKSSGKGKGRG